jgi:SmpA / OmlA family
VRIGGSALGLVLMLLPGRLAAAEGSDATTLRREVEQLKRTVERLNQKVETLERQQSPTPATQATAGPQATPAQPGPASAPPSGMSERWSKLRHGMTTGEVETLLGHPTRILTLNAKPVWYYVYTDVGGGSVAFTADGHLESWQRPPFRLWWW